MPAPAHVLDLFAVPGPGEPVPGGQGRSVRAGDLVLSPGRDADVQAWLCPVLARLAVTLDESPERDRRDLRIAMPVPARDGVWVVDGWGASRFEPGTVVCDDLAVTLAAGRVLHARLALAVAAPPDVLDKRTDRWARAERLAFGPVGAAVGAGTPAEPLVRRLIASLDHDPLGPDQLVHADLAGNVLLDGLGAPVVIDVAPAWRPVRWAEAVCTLDAVLWHGEPRSVLDRWTTRADREALRRAALFRILADGPPDWPEVAAYASVLDVVAPT